jgi:hypothetical protein
MMVWTLNRTDAAKVVGCEIIDGLLGTAFVAAIDGMFGTPANGDRCLDTLEVYSILGFQVTDPVVAKKGSLTTIPECLVWILDGQSEG